MDDLMPDVAFDAQVFLCEACGRNFTQMNAYSIHIGSCRPQKRRMASALGEAREKYKSKKSRLDTSSTQPQHAASSQPEVMIPAAMKITHPSSAVSGDSNISDSASLAERRPRREIRRPLRYRNEQPAAPASLPLSVEPLQPSTMSAPSPLPIISPARRLLKSPSNVFGLFRQYFSTAFPDHDPDSEIQAAELSDAAVDHRDVDIVPTSLFKPYPNYSTFLLGEWYWNNNIQKTKDDFQKLIHIISDDGFKPADIRNIPWDSLNQRLGEAANSEDMWLDELDAGWKETSITLSIPFKRNTPSPGLQQYTFPPFRHRSIVTVLKEKMMNSHDFRHFHLEPYELRWRRNNMLDTESTRVHGELYTSPAFLEAHEEIQALAAEPGCSLPRVLIGLMFGSDATQLASFGGASLWPCYMYFGNESKYRRCKPTCNLCNHIAYFCKIPPEFQDFAASHSNSKGPTDAFMTHCQREFLHAQWRELLDDDFLEAYEHGIVIECCDGRKRRFYLRIFAYSADYPEKVLLSSIRNMGRCPCPRCLIPKKSGHPLGTKRDQNQRMKLARIDDPQYRVKIASARDIIYNQNRGVDSIFVERLLKPESLVPTENAFSERLSRFGFNMFSIFLVDFMHEFELGVWKKVFIHLLRILECIPGATNLLNRRYRDMPTFGRDSIRRFTNSVSELKKLGARDYENLLQCSIPVFEGLLPNQHNTNLMDLLFNLAHWHALAKLRQHTDLSLGILQSVTIQLGESLKKFQETTCSDYDTRELKREKAARSRRAERKSTAGKTVPDNTGVVVPDAETVASKTSATCSSKAGTSKPKKTAGSLRKDLNLNTYKDHSLGDYVETIRRYGTVDSYSTESMELEHRSPKSRFLRTSRKDFEKQLGSIERRQARIRRIRQKLNSKTMSMLVHEKGPESSASAYHIGKTQNHPLDLGALSRNHGHDPAVKDFTKNLKEHLLLRVKERLQIAPEVLDPGVIEPTQVAQSTVLIKGNRIYRHKLARFYHTTYDVRRSEDIINPNTPHCNVMLLANPEANDSGPSTQTVNHPFLYGRVIGIYHANVVYTGPGMKDYEAMRFDFLHLRWFRLDQAQARGRGQKCCGWESLRLDCLSFPPMAAKDSFSFVDPRLVLRSCHLIPTFSSGKSRLDGIGLSTMSKDANDWKGYYVNRFADRDMTMRYHWGLAIGHTYSHSQDIHFQRYSTPTPADPPETSPDQDICPTPSIDPPEISDGQDVRSTPSVHPPESSHDQDIRYSTPSSADPPEIEALPAATGGLPPEVETDGDSELSDSDQEDEDYFDSDAGSSDSDVSENSDTDDEEFLEIYDTYYSD